MKSIEAKCVTSTELINGVRLAKFVCEIENFFDESFFDDFDYRYHMEKTITSLNIITIDQELKILWAIESSEFIIDEFKLVEYNKNVYGNFTIQTSDFEIGDILKRGTFDTNSLFLENLDSPSIYTGQDLQPIIFTFYVYYRPDETVMYSLAEDYDKFLKNQELSDITFVIGNQEIPAHKQIVSARNDVFAKMLNCDMLEKKNSRVEIIDIEEDIFKLLLRYIYSGNLETKDTEVLLKLLVAADKYSVKSLVSVCGYRLIDNLSVDNAIQIFITSDLVNVNFLKNTCMNFIMEKKDIIVGTQTYKEIAESSTSNFLTKLFSQAN